jgi:hypothetical protein
MHLTMADSGLLALDNGTNVFWPLFSFSLRAASEPAVDLDAGEARRDETITKVLDLLTLEQARF